MNKHSINDQMSRSHFTDEETEALSLPVSLRFTEGSGPQHGSAQVGTSLILYITCFRICPGHVYDPPTFKHVVDRSGW